MREEPFKLEDIDDLNRAQLEGYDHLAGAPAESSGERNSRLAKIVLPVMLVALVLFIITSIGMALFHRLSHVSAGYHQAVDESMLPDSSWSSVPGCGAVHLNRDWSLS